MSRTKPPDPARIPEILGRLKAVWSSYPDMRLGEIIVRVQENWSLYSIEDKDLIEAIEENFFGMKEKDKEDEEDYFA